MCVFSEYSYKLGLSECFSRICDPLLKLVFVIFRVYCKFVFVKNNLKSIEYSQEKICSFLKRKCLNSKKLKLTKFLVNQTVAFHSFYL